MVAKRGWGTGGAVSGVTSAVRWHGVNTSVTSEGDMGVFEQVGTQKVRQGVVFLQDGKDR